MSPAGVSVPGETKCTCGSATAVTIDSATVAMPATVHPPQDLRTVQRDPGWVVVDEPQLFGGEVQLAQ
jgi:hypothetical protein